MVLNNPCAFGMTLELPFILGHTEVCGLSCKPDQSLNNARFLMNLAAATPGHAVVMREQHYLRLSVDEGLLHSLFETDFKEPPYTINQIKSIKE